MKFTTYTKHGSITRHDCSLSEIKALFGDEGYLLGWPENNQYILDGKFVDIPEMPGAGYKWSYEYLMWVFSTEVAESQILSKRLILLMDTDWSQLPDVPGATSVKYKIYRQSLRDITTQTDYPVSVTFPTLPE